jgi:hypothetical protein
MLIGHQGFLALKEPSGMRIGLALRTGWKVLTDGSFAERIRQVLSGSAAPAAAQLEQKPAPQVREPRPARPARSDAIMLLAALQREARFVDLVCEPLDQYSDAQIGAAARDVLRDCGQVLERMFQLQPVLSAEEGSTVTVPAGFDAGCYRLSGQVEGQPPYQGRLAHHGWKAATCKLPQWSGSAEASLVVAPAEVEVAGTSGSMDKEQ